MRENTVFMKKSWPVLSAPNFLVRVATTCAIFYIFAPTHHHSVFLLNKFSPHRIIATAALNFSATISCSVSCLCLLSHVSILMSPFSCLMSQVSCLTSPVSHHLSHVTCLTSPVSRPLSHVYSTDCDKYKYDKYKMCDKVFEHRYPEKWEEKAWMKLYFPWEDVTIFILFTTWELYCKVFISNIIEYHPTQVLYFVQFFY